MAVLVVEDSGYVCSGPRGYEPGPPVYSAEGCYYPTWKRAAPVPGVSREPTGEGRGGVLGKLAKMMSDQKAEKIINDAFESLREICVKRPRGDKATRLVSNARVILMQALESLPEVADEKGVHAS